MLKISIEQDPEIRKMGQCTENIIHPAELSEIHINMYFLCERIVGFFAFRRCTVLPELSKVHDLYIKLVIPIVSRMWENICDVREDRDLLSPDFASPAMKRTRFDRARASEFRLVPTLRTELFSTARIYKSKGTESERSGAIPKINGEPIGRHLLL